MLESSLQIQRSVLLDDGTSHAHYLNLTAHAARGSIKTTYIPRVDYSSLQIQIHYKCNSISNAIFQVFRDSTCSIDITLSYNYCVLMHI